MGEWFFRVSILRQGIIFALVGIVFQVRLRKQPTFGDAATGFAAK